MNRPVQILGVVGARPQFVKAAAVHRAWRETLNLRQLRLRWLHTGQHYDAAMSGAFFDEFKLPSPDYRLRPTKQPGLPQFTDMLRGMAGVLRKFKPDAVLVFGDTNTTLAASLAASYIGVPVAHVEAGLRSFNPNMPEERNRVLTDHLSRWLFCPTPGAVKQLASEGIKRGVHRTGDVMADLLLKLSSAIPKSSDAGTYYLATIHRNTNTDDPKRLEAVLRCLEGLHAPVVLPVHPRTSSRIRQTPRLRKLAAALRTVRLVPPAPYGRMMALLKNARGVITDSGGVQKEAFLLGVPCVTLRAETEWPETVKLGRNRLCEPSSRQIQKAFAGMSRAWKRRVPGVYGRGDASVRILNTLLREISK